MGGAFVVLAILAVVALTMGAGWSHPSATHRTGPVDVASARAGSSVLSYNWAGYAATAGTGTVTVVSGAWTEPAVTCGSAMSLAAFWVGIDGYSDSTVEQDGTLAQCVAGTASYSAWWETYPANAVQSFGSIRAGDHISADVTFDPGTHRFTMTVNDTTSGTSWTRVSGNSGAMESSAECIAEAPGGAPSSSGLYDLADFGKVSFHSCSATISGSLGGIGTFGSVDKITMVSEISVSYDLAVPSALSHGGSSFKVTWESAA